MWLTIGVVNEYMNVELCSVVKVLQLFEKDSQGQVCMLTRGTPSPCFSKVH